MGARGMDLNEDSNSPALCDNLELSVTLVPGDPAPTSHMQCICVHSAKMLLYCK